jgi:DNA invertase Pin-like site-specific DNA recombinase
VKQQKLVAYYRVSTVRQGRSGLGLDAQRKAVADYAGGAPLLREFTEIESGKNNERPELQKAIRLCEATKATLVIAKLDRLSRNAAFLLSLQESLNQSGVRFIAADMPDANSLTIGIMAVIAQHEREAISKRTTEALAAARMRGVRLGNPNGAAALLSAGKGNRAALAAVQSLADKRAARVKSEIAELRAEGVTSLEGLAAGLNAREVQTPRGARWHASSVRNLLARLSI